MQHLLQATYLSLPRISHPMMQVSVSYCNPSLYTSRGGRPLFHPNNPDFKWSRRAKGPSTSFSCTVLWSSDGP
jgi:hypothetical protein